MTQIVWNSGFFQIPNAMLENREMQTTGP